MVRDMVTTAATGRATTGVMHRHTTAAVMPPPTMADMPRDTTVTDIEECTVRPMPTMVAPVIMAAGIVVGVTTGKTNTARSPAVFDLAASSLPDATSQPRYGLRAV